MVLFRLFHISARKVRFAMSSSVRRETQHERMHSTASVAADMFRVGEETRWAARVRRGDLRMSRDLISLSLSRLLPWGERRQAASCEGRVRRHARTHARTQAPDHHRTDTMDAKEEEGSRRAAAVQPATLSCLVWQQSRSTVLLPHPVPHC